MKHFLPVLFLFLTFQALAQIPSVSYLDNPMGNNEETPYLFPLSSGGFLVESTLTKTSPDSTFSSVSKLNSELVPQWTRVFKMRAKTTVYSMDEDASGNMTVMLNSYNTPIKYHPVLTKLSPSGALLETLEIEDSSNLAQGVPYFFHIKLKNDDRILFPTNSSANGLVTIHPEVPMQAFQPIFQNQTTQPLRFYAAKPIPGSSQWIGTGRISNTDLSFFIKMVDTTVLAFHVYNFSPASSSSAINSIQILPEGDVLCSSMDNGEVLHLMQVTINGDVVWRKSYKVKGLSFNSVLVAESGDIYAHGTTTPLSSGMLARFSSTGNYLGHHGQVKQGFSLGSISGFAALPNNNFFTVQRGYYNSSPTLILNRIHSSLDFACFGSFVAGFTDTTLSFSDSASTAVSLTKKRLGIRPTLTYPLKMVPVTCNTGPVICTPNAVSAPVSENPFLLYPNPARETLHVEGISAGEQIRISALDGRILFSGWMPVDGLDVRLFPDGIYCLSVPSRGIWRRFVKE